MELEQTMRAAFALRAPAPDFEDVVMQRLAARTWRKSQPAPRRWRHIVLIGTLLVVTAAAALHFMGLVDTPSKAVVKDLHAGSMVEPTAPAGARTGSSGLVPNGLAGPSSVRPVTVSLVLEQVTGDAIGRDYGHQVFERAREELLGLAGVSFIDAGIATNEAPAFRITYINLAESKDSAAQVAVEMIFQVEALRSRPDGAGIYQAVFRSHAPPPGVVNLPASLDREMIPSFNQEPPSSLMSARLAVRPAAPPVVPADCIQRNPARCPYTPADVAAFTILSWRLQAAAPDSMLATRLHSILRDSSSPPGLWMMALASLHKYGQLRLQAPELLVAIGRIGDFDPVLEAQLMREALKTGSRADLVREVRHLLLAKLPAELRSVPNRFRMQLVALLASDLKDEPETRGILESVAASAPEFDVRTAAMQALGMQRPSASFMGPTDDQMNEWQDGPK